VHVLERAAADALGRGVPDSAVALLRRALAEPPAQAARLRVLSQLGWAEYLAHQRQGAVEHLIDAMCLAQNANEHAALALRAGRVLIISSVDRSDEAVAILERAIPDIPEEESQVRMRLEAELIAAAGLKLST
jgi:tetratricopeptide (TPR) repeat protein